MSHSLGQFAPPAGFFKRVMKKSKDDVDDCRFSDVEKRESEDKERGETVEASQRSGSRLLHSSAVSGWNGRSGQGLTARMVLFYSARFDQRLWRVVPTVGVAGCRIGVVSDRGATISMRGPK